MPRKTEFTQLAFHSPGSVGTGSFQSAIHDRRGSPFVLKGCIGASEWKLEIETLDGDAVGSLEMEIENGIARIEHLHVCEVGPAVAPRWIKTLWRVLRRPPPTAVYRNRGLGSLLVIHAIDAVRSHRLHGIVAWIPASTALLGWFQKQGFSSHPCDNGFAVWRRTAEKPGRCVGTNAADRLKSPKILPPNQP